LISFRMTEIDDLTAALQGVNQNLTVKDSPGFLGRAVGPRQGTEAEHQPARRVATKKVIAASQA
jgi:hypothetical protein